MKLMVFLIIKLTRLIEGLTSRWRNLYYRCLGMKLDGYVWLRQVEIPRNHQAIAIATQSALDRGVVLLCSGKFSLQPQISIGKATYINRHTFIDAVLSITIGEHCAIGPNCYITDHNHGLDLAKPPLEQPMIAQPTKIGDRVWLGAKVTVLKGVTIGDDAVIGAGSVVTKNIPQGAIALGIPAKVIKTRYAVKSC